MKTPKYLSILSLAVIGALYGASPALAASYMGSDLTSFAVLGGSTVTNTGPTTITGNVGDWLNQAAANSVTGLLPAQVSGTIYQGPASANTTQALAHSQLAEAISNLGGKTITQNLTGSDLGGLTLNPGVYKFNSSAQLTGPLTLIGATPNTPFVFQIGSTLTTASGSSVIVKNGGANNVYWNVGSSATLGTNTSFEGNILAKASITLNNGATILDGSALAYTGAVTMASNKITTTVPEPQTYAMLLAGLGLLGFTAWRRKDLTV